MNPVHRSQFSRPNRALFIGACYGAGALIGAVLGLQYYLPGPPALSANFFMNDLRYPGAILGALVASAAVALVVRTSLPSALALSTLVVSLPLLGFLLLNESAAVGLATLLALILPWFLLLLPSRLRK